MLFFYYRDVGLRSVACEPEPDKHFPLDISTSKYNNPVQPNLQKFPQTNKRRYNAAFYKRFEWIEYSESEDSLYCFACRHFASSILKKGEIQGKRTFIDVGFRKWKDLSNLLEKHNKSERHGNAMISWLNFKAVENKIESSIKDKLVINRSKEVQTNREHVKCLLRVTSLLGRQGLAFRGHDESETSQNKGNFIETLEMLAQTNEILHKKMSVRYGHYTSPDYQNDLIEVFGKKICKNVSTQVKKANYFSILVDETKDQSRKEQLSLIIRFFDGEVIQERCCGTYHMKKLDAESLANFILKQLDELGLERSDCIAQCYDGASVMSGWASGVQARVAEKVPQAIYIHCYAHRLNLVLIDCVKNINEFAEFFSTIQTLYNFISNSNLRHELFVKAQKELGNQVLELERTVATRWFYWYKSIYKIRARYEAILVVLNSLAESSNEASMEASGLKSRMESWRFIVCLFVAEKLFLQTNCLSEQLQEKGISIVRAVDLISTTKTNLTNMRSDREYEMLYDEAQEFAKNLEIDVPDVCATVGLARSKRVQKTSNRLKDYFTSSTLGKRQEVLAPQNLDLKQHLKTELYLPILDKCTVEFDRRFSDNIQIFQSLSAFDSLSKDFFDEEKLTQFAKHYSEHIDTVLLISQIHSAKRFLEQKKPEDIIDKYIALKRLPGAFSELLSSLKILLTIPVTTASNERFFSVLKHVKNYLRTKTGDDRLSSLLLMATEKDMVKSFDLEELVDDFAHMRNRRYPLV